jgi:hypothetical protein
VPEPGRPAGRLRLAIVLGGTEDACRSFAGGRAVEVPYASAFPRPRLERVAPGHLVAIATAPDQREFVVWRWFDAVVTDRTEATVTLWEPNHGVVVAQARDPQQVPAPGSRAYLSSGLPGAQWWLAGPVVERAESAEVELAEVEDFFTSHGLWNHLTQGIL